MHIVQVNDFSEWRKYARHYIHCDVAPEAIEWMETDTAQTTLFEPVLCSAENEVLNTTKFSVPINFFKLAKKASYHRDARKWSLLYMALWRIIKGERHLLELKTDPILYEILSMAKAVGRDSHKMKAFVRFRCYKVDDKDYYIARYKSQHKVLKRVAPFFKERFNIMNWAIFTPDGSVAWDGVDLKFSDEVVEINEIDDGIESLWLTYYRSIFNPARIKLKAMHKEMPRHYWETMPETKLIPAMLEEAPKRVDEMLRLSLGKDN